MGKEVESRGAEVARLEGALGRYAEALRDLEAEMDLLRMQRDELLGESQRVMQMHGAAEGASELEVAEVLLNAMEDVRAASADAEETMGSLRRDVEARDREIARLQEALRQHEVTSRASKRFLAHPPTANSPRALRLGR